MPALLHDETPPQHVPGAVATDQAADREREHRRGHELGHDDRRSLADAAGRIGVRRERDPDAELGDAEPEQGEAQAA